MSTLGRMVVLSGPSCIDKSPLAKALAQFHPDLHEKLQPLVLYNSRSPSPGEKDGQDYHFRRREEIENLRKGEFRRDGGARRSSSHVIANHDGEDSENWNAFYFPLGDAGRTFNIFVQLLKGGKAAGTELWEKDFIACGKGD